MSEPSTPDDDFDDGEITGSDPGDSLVPGSASDVEHDPAPIGPGDPDYVEAADDVDAPDDEDDDR